MTRICDGGTHTVEGEAGAALNWIRAIRLGPGKELKMADATTHEQQTHQHNDECSKMQDALASARARQTLPQRETAAPGFQAVHTADPQDIAPSATEDLGHDIRNLEQSLRDMGCEPK